MIRRPPRSTLFPLHDALPISGRRETSALAEELGLVACVTKPVKELRLYEALTSALGDRQVPTRGLTEHNKIRSEEHTSELQSRQYLVCRLLLEKKKQTPCLAI